MNISVALDGSKQRDLIFAPGDEMTVNLTVYAHDGDTTPITVTNLQASTGGGALFPVGSQFTVPCCLGRTPYRIAGDVNGVTTTLVFGILEAPFSCDICWDCCGIFPANIATAMAANVTVSDAGQYYTGTNVEDVLQEIAVRLRAHGI